MLFSGAIRFTIDIGRLLIGRGVMAIKPIVVMGVASLLEKSESVKDFDSPGLKQLIQDLRDTQYHLQGVGISAPQIGVNLRVILFGFEQCERYTEQLAVKETVLINPEYEALSQDKELGWEGCLSVPGLRGAVSRYTHIRYCGHDLDGQPIEGEAKGFKARIIQHEVDHLNGILFVHRIEDWRLFGYEEVLDLNQL